MQQVQGIETQMCEFNTEHPNDWLFDNVFFFFFFLSNQGLSGVSSSGGSKGRVAKVATTVHSAKFMSAASECDGAVRESRASLARLERLIGRAQLFANAAEVEAHVAALRASLALHQAAVDHCDQLADAAERRANAQARAHFVAVRGELRRRVQRLAKRFTDVLQKHGDGQKRRRRAQALLVGGADAATAVADDATSATSASPAAAASAAASAAPVDAGVRQRRRVPVGSGLGGGSGGGDDGAVPSGQSSVLLHVKDYGQQRRAAEQVEATIFELSGMMHRISHSVAEQHELFSRIDVTLEESETMMARAQAQLLQYWDALQGDRAFAIKLLAAVLFVALMMFWFFR